MTPTSRATQTELKNLLDYLVDSEIALYTNTVRTVDGVVSWQPYVSSTRFLSKRRSMTSAYRHWIKTGAYSAVLADGSLLQFTYEFAGSSLIRHRLAYVPCPFTVDAALLQTEAILDVFDLYADGRTEDVVLHTTVRFDFDLSQAGPEHPAAHLTINGAECRVPCAGPLRIGQFVDFVFRNFYPDLWRTHPYLRKLPKSPVGARTVSDDEMQRLHVSWRA